MRQRNLKTRCVKRKLSKCDEVVKTFDKVQYAYADCLENNPQVTSFKCNVPFDDKTIGDFTSDFVCTKSDGDLMIRECVISSNLTRPRTTKFLDFSLTYWKKRGINDWKVVIENEEE